MVEDGDSMFFQGQKWYEDLVMSCIFVSPGICKLVFSCTLPWLSPMLSLQD
jgi:hypothetical protein